MKRPEREDSFNSMDMISDLPKDILQRILYFLSQEDAVRTSVLSKSWRNIWCTRPNLDFSIYAFKENKQEFLTAVDKTLQLYCYQSLCVEEFRLSILLDRDFYEESISLLEKWIPLLTNMGTKEFRLWIGTQSYPGVMHLPPVVFEAEPLKDLRVRGFMLDRKAIRRIQLLKNLRILRLKQVFISDDDIDSTIKTHAPSLEIVDSDEWNIPLLKGGGLL
ncbi:PREDICTED: putative FBD-associated F-box protein At5g22720 [Erythranthe guttata]|uniref:putative FBD-associated F-box protein At5g22720 n=1 Tax=Erythranthe guttata TaxID=4155 RepID=UPI00064DD800|nr:PREDICTED: putative FBD-associated F-box protein At5g22720 [Erythranthe guttata]|eukprot:XP_012845982.1 PREDICTED: putative FBD-associated F-box protein At5g22720 [Erythranthe guttata]